MLMQERYMESGYKIEWTEHALTELSELYDYLEMNWTEREMSNLSNEIEKTIRLISINPKLFQETKYKKGVRRVVILKYNSLYYRVVKDSNEILSFFSNRKNPKNLKV